MRETGLTTNVKAKETSSHKKEQSTEEDGKMTSKMARGLKLGPLVPSMSECIRTDSSMEVESFDGLTTASSVENSISTTYKDMENTTGLMAVYTKDTGIIIKCMEKVCFVGKTERCTREITIWIRKKDMECSRGLKGRNMKEIGRIINNMEKDTISLKVEKEG